jgi:hypothetical protein
VVLRREIKGFEEHGFIGSIQIRNCDRPHCRCGSPRSQNPCQLNTERCTIGRSSRSLRQRNWRQNKFTLFWVSVCHDEIPWREKNSASQKLRDNGLLIRAIFHRPESIFVNYLVSPYWDLGWMIHRSLHGTAKELSKQIGNFRTPILEKSVLPSWISDITVKVSMSWCLAIYWWEIMIRTVIQILPPTFATSNYLI